MWHDIKVVEFLNPQGPLGALVRLRMIGWQDNGLNKPNNNTNTKNNRAATHREPIRKEACEGCCPTEP